MVGNGLLHACLSFKRLFTTTAYSVGKFGRSMKRRWKHWMIVWELKGTSDVHCMQYHQI